MAMRWITERETGVMLKSEEHFTKSGDRLMEMLRTKHQDTCPLSSPILDSYTGQPLELVPVEIAEDTVTEIAGRLSGGAVPGGGRGGGGGIGAPATLAPEVWGSKRGVASDSGRIN